ncbi:hypothetical protein EJ04DRAFT_102299 [Polyplosphaeria fusca]|uniref:Secreted protein n=1 Tax=Polyplosphaeria fusca TaxID=682080 RepID=A0A9P4V499_9PLEO|nr:hypothetical protein EJ04DRAFT_102299 [Polyplosphaeria fusca]
MHVCRVPPLLRRKLRWSLRLRLPLFAMPLLLHLPNAACSCGRGPFVVHSLHSATTPSAEQSTSCVLVVPVLQELYAPASLMLHSYSLCNFISGPPTRPASSY